MEAVPDFLEPFLIYHDVILKKFVENVANYFDRELKVILNKSNCLPSSEGPIGEADENNSDLVSRCEKVRNEFIAELSSYVADFLSNELQTFLFQKETMPKVTKLLDSYRKLYMISPLIEANSQFDEKIKNDFMNLTNRINQINENKKLESEEIKSKLDEEHNRILKKLKCPKALLEFCELPNTFEHEK